MLHFRIRIIFALFASETYRNPQGLFEALPDIYPAAATGKRPMRNSPLPPFRSITKAEQRLRISPIMITFANCSRTVDGRRKHDSATVRAKGHTHDNDISK